jgi:Smg protein
MKQDIFEVLIYLFENYLDEDTDTPPDSDAIRTDLIDAGFENTEVNKAFDWLDSLTRNNYIKPSIAPAFRIFCDREIAKLNLECRNFLIFLELSGILQTHNREIVIDRIMALEDNDISLEKLKWIVLMVLFSQPGDDNAYSRMEDLIYDAPPAYLH